MSGLYSIIQKIKDKLASDIEEAQELQETPPSAYATAICMEIAKIVAPYIMKVQGCVFGAFTEDEGGISFVIQSIKLDRRVNFRIPSTEHAEYAAVLITIDENGEAKEETCNRGSDLLVVNAVKWVLGITLEE